MRLSIYEEVTTHRVYNFEDSFPIQTQMVPRPRVFTWNAMVDAGRGSNPAM